MSSSSAALNGHRNDREELRADCANYIEWARYVCAVLQRTGSGLDKYLDGHGHGWDADERTQTCNILWDTLGHPLQRDAALHGLFQRGNARGLWDALEARDVARRDRSTAGSRVRAVEAVLAVPLEDEYAQPLQTVLRDQALAHLRARPSWYALEHLEAELKAAGVKRALQDQFGAEKRAQLFEQKLDAISGPLDHQGLERICREIDEWHESPGAN